jgi:tetratricopeptide (TPR) repeat protein
MAAPTLPTSETGREAAEWIARFGDLADEAARRESIGSAPPALDLAPALHAEVLRLAYADVERAARFAEAAGWLAEIASTDAAKAYSFRCRGHVHFARGQHAEAVENYEAAIGLLASGSDLDIGRTLNSGLQALIYLGQYDRAFEWAERARAIFSRHGDELRLARLSSNMGNILYRQDRYAEAMQCYQAAREPLSRLGEPRDVAAVLSNMAVCCTSLRRFEEALANYRAAREHCVQHQLPSLVAAADYNIAYLHYLRGDYIQAARLYRVSRADAEQAGDFYHVALCDLDESEMCLELNLSDEAARLARSAAARFERSGMNYERAKAVVNQAMAASQMADRDQSLRLLRGARRLFQNENNQIWPALIDLYQAILRYQQGRYPAARRLARKAARVLAGSQLLDKAALRELLRAQLLWKEGKTGQAREACTQILASLDCDAGPSLRFHIHFVLGQVEEELGHWDAAWKSYQSARSEIENLRSRLRGDELKISILKDKLAVYEALVWLSLWRRAPDAAFTEEALVLVQQAKSRSLADQIAFPWLSSSGSNREIEQRVQEIRSDLNWHYRQIELSALLAKSGLPAELATLRRQARQQEEKLIRGLSELRAAERDPQSADSSVPIDLDQIRAAIAPDAILLEYYEVRGTLYACLLSRSEMRMLPVADAAAVRDLLRRLQFQFDKFRLGEKYLRSFESPMLSATLAHLEALHALLIEPVRPLLKARHLVIAPHSFLHQLPFHALRSGGRFLLDDFSISYTPSASVYALCCGREAKFTEKSLVMGIPDAQTPSIENEARAAAAALPNARLMLGADATEAALRLHGPASRFIHIATHGLFRSDNPMFSSIRLGDSHLNLFDLYQLPLAAELVTLSGCSTGLNGVVGGDELVGLVRGLFYAGAHGVLVSLWDVQDRTTAEFMSVFYKQLQQHSNKADAVRSAMLHLKETYPHPYFWAPFVLVGKYGAEYGSEKKLGSGYISEPAWALS